MRLRMLATVERSPADFDAVATSFLPRVMHSSRAGDPGADRLVPVDGARGRRGRVRAATAGGEGRDDSRPSLGAIRCPTVVVCGRDDQATPLALSEEMASMIPEARLTVIDDCGHMAPMEKPQAVTDALAGWLASVT